MRMGMPKRRVQMRFRYVYRLPIGTIQIGYNVDIFDPWHKIKIMMTFPRFSCLNVSP